MNLGKRLARADIETLREIIREAESYLAAQLAAGVAADQRALALSGMLAAASAVIASGGISLLVGMEKDFILGSLAMAVAFGFIMAMLFSIISAAPRVFNFVGTFPSNWVDDIERNINLSESLAEQAGHYDNILKQNNEILRKNGKMMRWSIWVAWSSIVIGFFSGCLLVVWRNFACHN
ncbi:hypothetical protein P7L78_19000 [Tistrella bauzanensis]|uniref:hypothetical protein n=1 Tax=Tistrella TaxID=171436 RepID=UPI0031F65007